MEQLFNLDAEKALIGSILINPDAIHTITLDADDFYSDVHRKVWRTITALAAERRQIDIIIVSESSGVDFVELSKMTDFTSFSFNAPEYALAVKDKARRRKVVDVASRLAKAAYTEDERLDTTKYIDELINNSARESSGAVHISAFTGQTLAELDEKIENPGADWGLQTGLVDFDAITGGLQTGESVILSGEPGVGKSLLAVQMGIQLGQHGSPGVIYSLEMQGKAVARRMISGESKINTRSIKAGTVTEAQYQDVRDAINRLNNLPVFMSDASSWTLTELHADMARLKRKEGIKWFLLDYLYLLDAGRNMNEIESTTVLSRGIKQICKSLDLAGITIHSMNKTGMDTNAVGKSMLRGSGQVVYDADLICMLTRDDTQESVRHFKIVKGRELAKDNPHFSLVKSAGFPYFGAAVTTKSIF